MTAQTDPGPARSTPCHAREILRAGGSHAKRNLQARLVTCSAPRVPQVHVVEDDHHFSIGCGHVQIRGGVRRGRERDRERDRGNPNRAPLGRHAWGLSKDDARPAHGRLNKSYDRNYPEREQASGSGSGGQRDPGGRGDQPSTSSAGVGRGHGRAGPESGHNRSN